jgi:hypothetical protein
LLQEQVLSGWSQIMHMNSLAIAGDYREFAVPATGRWLMAQRSQVGSKIWPQMAQKQPFIDPCKTWMVTLKVRFSPAAGSVS